MRIIAIANQKGGCGKTTVTINLAACLAREGRRTLAIDLDPQGHCALGLAVPEEQIEVSIAQVLRAEPGSEAPDLSRVIWQISSNFDLIPSKVELSKLERELADVQDREQRLLLALRGLEERYDFIIIDTPPTIGFLTESTLFAADEVIVPVDTGYFSLHGLAKQLDTIRGMRAAWDKTLPLRIIANHYDVRTKLGREILAEMRKRHGDSMFTAFINFNTKLKESASLGQPITEYDPSSVGCRDFVGFARELIASPAPAPTPMPAETRAIAELPVVVRASEPAVGRTPEDKTLLERADALAADADKLLATTQTLIGRGRTAEESPATTAAMEHPAPAVADEPVGVLPDPTPAETARKIERIYGPQAAGDGVIFRVRAEGASHVQVAGDFNDWNPGRTPMQHVDGDTFQIKVPLEPGRYMYRYVVDGHWRNDPENHYVQSNPYGELNNVLEFEPSVVCPV